MFYSMRTSRGFLLVAIIAISAFHGNAVLGEGQATYSYSQQNLNTSTESIVFYSGSDTSSLPIAVTHRAPDDPDTFITETMFDVDGTPLDPTQLTAKAVINVIHDEPTTTEEVGLFITGSATATSSLTDVVTVQVGGEPYGSPADIEFTWNVTGSSSLGLNVPNEFDNLFVNDLSTTAFLESSVAGVGDVLTHEFPGGFDATCDGCFPSGTWSEDLPWAFDNQSYSIPWPGNTAEIPVIFDLTTSANLDLEIEATAFTANTGVDFSSTAVLDSVVIRDPETSSPIEGAELVSQNGIVYPVGGDPGPDPDPDPDPDPEPEPAIEVRIDIRPYTDWNLIWLYSPFSFPVAAFSTEDFNVADIDIDSLLFGDPELVAEGATPVAPKHTSFRDINYDGLEDLKMWISIPELVDNGAFDSSTEIGQLTGSTISGTEIFGSDSVWVFPPEGSIFAIPEPSSLLLVLFGIVVVCAGPVTGRSRRCHR